VRVYSELWTRSGEVARRFLFVLLWASIVHGSTPAPICAQPTQSLALRVATIRYGEDGVGYGTRYGLSAEIALVRSWPAPLFVAAGARLTIAPQLGDDYLLLAEFNDELVEVVEPALILVPGVQVGAGICAVLGPFAVSFAPEAGVLLTRGSWRGGTMKFAPIAAFVVEARLGSVGGFARAGALRMPITWERSAGGTSETVRTFSEWRRILEVGAVVRL